MPKPQIEVKLQSNICALELTKKPRLTGEILLSSLDNWVRKIITRKAELSTSVSEISSTLDECLSYVFISKLCKFCIQFPLTWCYSFINWSQNRRKINFSVYEWSYFMYLMCAIYLLASGAGKRRKTFVKNENKNENIGNTLLKNLGQNEALICVDFRVKLLQASTARVKIRLLVHANACAVFGAVGKKKTSTRQNINVLL